MNRQRTVFAASLFLFSVLSAVAQDQSKSAVEQKPAASAAPSEEAQADALQKAVQNFAYDPYNRTQNVLNIQPVIPIRLSENWNLIARIIQPLVWQPYPNQNTGGEYGLGDMNPSFFLSPAKPGKLIWGVGPALVIPTATSTILGQGKLSLGPSVVVLAQTPHWTIGALINNVWSVPGSGGRPPVNQMLPQYFVNYNMKSSSHTRNSGTTGGTWFPRKKRGLQRRPSCFF